MVVTGSAGAGKSRLAREAASRVRASGAAVIYAAGAHAARGIPFGGLPELAPLLDTADADVLRRPRTYVRELRTKQHLPLIVVDDAQWLDELSLAFLHQVLIQGEATLLLTVRDGQEKLPPTVTGFWKEGLLARMELPLFTARETADFAAALLGGPLDLESAALLHRHTGGLALAIREILLHPAATPLAVQDGRRRFTGPLRLGTRLADLIGERLDGLAPDALLAVQVLALCEPLPSTLLGELAGTEAMLEADRAQLLTTTDAPADPHWTEGHGPPAPHGGGDLFVRLDSPVVAQVARQLLTPLAERALLRRVVTTVEHSGALGRWAGVRLAGWRLQLGDDVDTTSLLHAARLAQAGLDFGHAQRFTAAAWAQERTYENGIVHASVLRRLGRRQDAADVLAQCAPLSTNDTDRGSVAVLLAETLTDLDQGAAAVAAVREARASVRDPALSLRLLSHIASFTMLGGDSRGAFSVVEQACRNDESLPAVWFTAALALSMDGRPLRALELCDRTARAIRSESGSGDAPPSGSEDPLAPPAAIAGFPRVLALYYAGRLKTARSLASAALEQAQLLGLGYAVALWQQMLGRIELERGLPATAADLFTQVILNGRTARSGQESMAATGLLEARGLLGERRAIHEARHLLAETPGPGQRYPAGLKDLATGWGDVGTTGPSQAWKGFNASVERSVDTNRSVGLMAAHALARTGALPQAVTALERLDVCEGELPELRVEHIRALRAGDDKRLAAAAEGFESLGATLLSAECWADTARAAEQAGLRRPAAGALVRLAELLPLLEGAVTPALSTQTLPGRLTALTARERDIATRAAQGVSNQRIADELVLSRRTVENHLQRIYQKLGVAGRHELSRALGRALDATME